MPDGFDVANLTVSPMIERIPKEDGLNRDQARRQRIVKSKAPRKTADAASPDEPEDAAGSPSVKHIDLRI